MLAVGDALALVVSRMRGFAREDFARFHPAGNLGLKLSKVQKQLHLPRKQDLLQLVDCPLDADGLVGLLREQGVLPR